MQRGIARVLCVLTLFEDGSARDYLSSSEDAIPEASFELRGVTNFSTIEFKSLQPFVDTIE
ncbi:hypothetical protein LVJ94_13690 [Pendulispora rubella]|uniref:Uncharacterized protein n=1 Tax=Pendulispora rubella TaxID=2741070 RepID=A0ABZ2LBL2_9BACT